MPTGKGYSVTEWSQVPAVARPLPEPEPQPVLAPLTTAAIFMVLTIEPGGEEAVRDLLADWAGLQRSVGFRVPEAPLACVAGIGSEAWDRLFAGPRPAELHPFRELDRDRAPRRIHAGRPALPRQARADGPVLRVRDARS